MNNVGSKTLFNPVIEIGACSDDSSLHHQSLILNLIYVKSDVGVGQRGTSHMFVCGVGQMVLVHQLGTILNQSLVPTCQILIFANYFLGLVTAGSGLNTIRFRPALICTRHHINIGLGIIESELNKLK